MQTKILTLNALHADGSVVEACLARDSVDAQRLLKERIKFAIRLCS